MTQCSNKLQIRAKILSVLSELKMNKTLSQSLFMEQILPLRDIEDKDAIFAILLKELNKAKDTYLTVIKATLVETIPTEELKGKIFDILTSKKITDEVKYQLIQILKDIGSPIDYDKFFNYFEDPDSVLDYDTQKLLEFAIVNPETQIDFLDFLTSLPEGDKFTLINSLNEDYFGDNLANILTPILYSEFSEAILVRTVEILGESKSSIPIEAIEDLQERSKSSKLFAACKKSLGLLKLSGASKEKAEHFYKLILSESKICGCYTTIPDGHSNQGIIVVRARKDETYQMFALVVNHIYGIVDCFGFNFLTEQELDRIITRFYKEDIRIEVSPEYCKSIINDALNKTKILNGSFSYEYACWSILLKDTKEMPISVQDFVEKNVSLGFIDESILLKMYEKPYFDKWFLEPSDSQTFKDMLEEFYIDQDLTIEKIEKKLDENSELIWTTSLVNDFEKRLLNTVYLVYTAGFADDASCLYSILKNQSIKSKIYKDILKKSVYEAFALTKQNLKENKFSTNIFRLNKQKSEEKITLKQIDAIIKDIEAKWIN